MRFSIFIPVYHDARWMPGAVDSILGQDPPAVLAPSQLGRLLFALAAPQAAIRKVKELRDQRRLGWLTDTVPRRR